MNATSASQSSVRTGAIAAVFAAALGLGMVFMTGLVQASSLHDAAHDVRHATGFPCH
ncbi:CbtB domain-containing protein [Albibacillus kandeliae]|uniref:CbtB domain-containing protein n=1 Tax=Albibacillus kandeliae TaxID=2174228 RepID=UPI000D69EFDF|nr:CbtB domain-containing protein [Albibacillus kandeliae]